MHCSVIVGLLILGVNPGAVNSLITTGLTPMVKRGHFHSKMLNPSLSASATGWQCGVERRSSQAFRMVGVIILGKA